MAVPYYGDYPEDHAEIRIPFNTFDSNDPSASVTITDLADSDIEVHADGNTTQIATDGASVVINFAGETGSHMVLIDSSVHSDYTTATEYAVKIVGTTIDGATVNAWIGAFSIERAGGALATALLTNTVVDGIAAKLVGITLLNEWLGAIAGKQNANATALTEMKASGAGSGTYDPNTDSTEALRDRGDAEWVTATGFNTTTPDAAGTAPTAVEIQAEMEANGASLLDTIRDELANGTDGLSALKALIDAVQTEVDKIGVVPALDGAGQTIGAAIAKLADDNAGADFDAGTDSLQELRDRGDAAWTTGAGGSAPTVEEIRAEIDSNSTEIAAIKGHTGQIGTAGASLTDLGGMSTTMKGQVNAECDTALSDMGFSAPRKNVALADLSVLMVESGDHVTPKTGLTLTVTRSLDGGAFGAGTGTAAEIANGMYQYDASQADMNADVIIFRFTGTDADDSFITIHTRS